MQKLGKKQLTLQLQQPILELPKELNAEGLVLSENGTVLTYTYDAKSPRAGIAELLSELTKVGILFKDLHTNQSSLEDIFVSLVSDRKSGVSA